MPWWGSLSVKYLFVVVSPLLTFSILNIYLALLHTFYTVYLHDNNEQITKIIFRGNHCCKKPTGPRVPLEMCNPTIVTEKFGWLWT